jgi:hypothetical protein
MRHDHESYRGQVQEHLADLDSLMENAPLPVAGKAK